MQTEQLPDLRPNATKPAMPMTLGSIRAQLCAPFHPSIIELKPGATNPDKTKALALAYVDARHYQQRLDDIAGPDSWSVEFRPVSDRSTVCRLTVCGVVREDVGEAETSDPNQATSAAMQAFKRACAGFGLGRYLYTDLPQLWADCEQRGKTVVIKDIAGIVEQMYHRADIALDKRSQYISRIKALLGSKSEDELLAIGKQLANGTK